MEREAMAEGRIGLPFFLCFSESMGELREQCSTCGFKGCEVGSKKEALKSMQETFGWLSINCNGRGLNGTTLP